MYLTDQYHYSDTDPLMQRKLNSITVVDFKLQQKLVRDQFYVYAGVNNLFDKDYEESYGFPQAGRMVYGGLKIIF
jgi:outer membrane cobalamin receptor